GRGAEGGRPRGCPGGGGLGALRTPAAPAEGTAVMAVPSAFLWLPAGRQNFMHDDCRGAPVPAAPCFRAFYGGGMLGSARAMAFVPATDLSRARDFYEGLLGLEVLDVSGFACVFRVGGGPPLGGLVGEVAPRAGT